MRENLVKLIKKTIIRKYSLPLHCPIQKINKTQLTTTKDDCYSSDNINDLAEIIYNSIIEYAFNEFEIKTEDLQNLHYKAIQTKIRYSERDDEETKIRYGFYGEVLLHAFLNVFYNSKTLIAKGYFYNPTENSETKGYDSYHLIENDKEIQLWFGEVKFRELLSNSFENALKGLKQALDDEYLKKNLFAIFNRKNDLNESRTKLEEIRKAWELNPSITLIDELKKYNMKLIYPIFIIYKNNKDNYDEKINSAINYINNKKIDLKYQITINYEIFFIFLPLKEVKIIKQQVLEWIEQKKPLIS